LSLTLASIVIAGYPFTNECSCDEFCDYKCAPDEQPVQNITVYRMSMQDVYGLANKDTGDIAGDASFVISRRMTAY